MIPSGPGDAVLKFTPGAASGSLASNMGLTGSSRQNISLYRLGVGATINAQAAAVPGADGTPPTPGDIQGDELKREGIYALEDVDLFNLLCIPGRATRRCSARRWPTASSGARS